ncbi:TetR/AcrR family transcriptional regulator [Kitasatospora sp. NA04385]|uniref:TetR/AcrR family transcriptional regulator n=1 Tax=Kitasatospora sp. NA04385 TaxID=2742135 RepID=UPI001592018E|nr:TetR/AcrR family transcriptional regulator [Kitasatospora sp. NA04385]QKW20836.1 TetR/AcrR family transcriptional regulator [Kitasatospora sp. NA04385]
MATRARARLLDTAEALFYAEGIRAVGVERILADSGVGRASFYRHFTGKDELVVAVLTRRDQVWRDWLAERVTAHGGRPAALFDALAERFARADFRGCAFINTMVETADPDSPAHRVAAAHKRRVTEYVAALLAAEGRAPGPAAELARRLVLLMDGAIVTALREGTTAPAAEAGAIAAALLASAPPAGPPLEDPCAAPADRG